jgi:hypothetical protein
MVTVLVESSQLTVAPSACEMNRSGTNVVAPTINGATSIVSLLPLTMACVDPIVSEIVRPLPVALICPLAYTTLAPRRSKTPRSGTKTRPARTIGASAKFIV